MLPSSLVGAIKALLFTNLLRSTLTGILAEPFKPRSPIHQRIQLATDSTSTSLVLQQDDPLDESVDAFFSRRFGAPLAENLISAMIHGIYSGDTRKLSMRALFPSVWEAERESRSIILGLIFSGLKRKMGILKESNYLKAVKKDEEIMETIKTGLKATERGKALVERMEGASVWGVKGGLEKLTDRLRDYLVSKGVEIRMEAEGNVEQVKWENGEWKVSNFWLSRCKTERADPFDRRLSPLGHLTHLLI